MALIRGVIAGGILFWLGSWSNRQSADYIKAQKELRPATREYSSSNWRTLARKITTNTAASPNHACPILYDSGVTVQTLRPGIAAIDCMSRPGNHGDLPGSARSKT